MNIRMIISPAKKMVTDNDWLAAEQMPCFLDRTEKIRAYLDHLSYEELKQLWGCSDKLARENEQRLRQMRLTEHLTPALLAYEGIQYQYMAPRVFTDDQWDYVRSHLRILSGFYGVLRPTDGVVPYRLEMQAEARVDGAGDLYEFWGADICREVSRDADVILNLASKEYSRCVEAYAPGSAAGDHLCVRREKGRKSGSESHPGQNGQGRDGPVSGGVRRRGSGCGQKISGIGFSVCTGVVRG